MKGKIKMKYFKVTCTNGYCGCDENFYITAENERDAWEEAEEILTNEYSFWDPDSRFVDDLENWDELEEYYENCEAFVDEITKEEYEEYQRDYE